MIRLHDIQKKYQDIRVQIEKRVLDSFLLNYIKEPVIDEDKLLLIISILDRPGLSKQKWLNYALSTMLIQIALDTHEQIMKSSFNDKSRQLTVLAGDYFSGLYYKLLADMEDISMIRSLSLGIKEINEHKIFVYQDNGTDVEALMASLMAIEASLLLRLAVHLDVDSENDFFGQLLFFKRLLRERNQFLNGEGSILFEALNRIVFFDESDLMDVSDTQKNRLIQICENYLELSKDKLRSEMEQSFSLNEVIKSKAAALIDQYHPVANNFAEEG